MRKFALLIGMALGLSACVNAPQEVANIIVDANIIDGTGAKAYVGDVRFNGDKIICVGKCSKNPNDKIIDGEGLVLSPGFIDTHSHHDRHLDKNPEAMPLLTQGVTTIVVGEDGESVLPIANFFSARLNKPTTINVATYVGHGTIRAAVMGADYKRAASPQEIKQMEELVAIAMQQGALGLSTGLEYDPAIYSTHEEVIALAKIAARFNGRYISHMRSEDIALDEAIDEVIEIGRVAKLPVQISHLKIAMVDKWGQADKIIAKLNAARAQGIEITADVYPYTYWQSSLDVLLPARDFKDKKAAQFALEHLAKPEDLIITNFPPNQTYIGKSVAEVAKIRAKDEITTFLDLNIEADAMGKGSGVMGRAMSEADVAALIGWEHSNICSDGRIIDMHPRGSGSFPRVIAWLVRDVKQLSLETAIYKMTGLAAAHMGFKDRGKIAKGMVADLVLFDAENIKDKATFQNPSAKSEGVILVWVNGTLVYQNGQATGQMPGKAINRNN